MHTVWFRKSFDIVRYISIGLLTIAVAITTLHSELHSFQNQVMTSAYAAESEHSFASLIQDDAIVREKEKQHHSGKSGQHSTIDSPIGTSCCIASCTADFSIECNFIIHYMVGEAYFPNHLESANTGFWSPQPKPPKSNILTS